MLIKGVGCKSILLNYYLCIIIIIKYFEWFLEFYLVLMIVISLFNFVIGLRQISICIVLDLDVGGKYFVFGGWVEMCRVYQVWMSECC